MSEKRVYIWCPESPMHGQVHQFPDSHDFLTVLGPPQVGAKYLDDKDHIFAEPQKLMTLAICKYKAPNGIIWIARQGIFPGVQEMIHLWPELSAMFYSGPTEACPGCNKYMAQNWQMMTWKCHWCGVEFTDQYLAELKVDKVKDEYEQALTEYQKTLQEKAAALDKAINEAKKKSPAVNSILEAQNQYNHLHINAAKSAAMKKILDEMYDTTPVPEFSYYDKAYKAEFEGVRLDPSLWKSDDDAGLL